MCEAVMELDMDALEMFEEDAEAVGSEGEQEEEQPSSTRKKSGANPKKRKGGENKKYGSETTGTATAPGKNTHVRTYLWMVSAFNRTMYTGNKTSSEPLHMQENSYVHR